MRLQLTLSDEEYRIFTEYGEIFGYSVPKTVKYFLSKVIEDMIQHNELLLPSIEERKMRMREKSKMPNVHQKTTPKRPRPTIKKPFSATRYIEKLENSLE